MQREPLDYERHEFGRYADPPRPTRKFYRVFFAACVLCAFFWLCVWLAS